MTYNEAERAFGDFGNFIHPAVNFGLGSGANMKNREDVKEKIEKLDAALKENRQLMDFLDGEDPRQPIYADPSEFYGSL